MRKGYRSKQNTGQALFFKPANGQDSALLHRQRVPALDGNISFRSLNLDTDLLMIHNWMNQVYAKRFWQMDKPLPEIGKIYQSIIENPHAHSFIGLFNDRVVCLIDSYQVLHDELADHVDAEANDCGIHLLMSPPREHRRDMSFHCLREFLAFYFSFPEAHRIYAEPDCRNLFANKLAMRVGLRFLREISLSYKMANLYSLSKSEFHNN
ncbi:MAG TPA: GNAT family N-acetyltransferase [Puia sp.]|nr:GNAT family N-acetyltransferase [Puia sp.]